MKKIIVCALVLLGTAFMVGCRCVPENQGADRVEEGGIGHSGRRLLERFPPGEWGLERFKAILEREIRFREYRTPEEREFIENYEEWKVAKDGNVSGK